MRYKKLSGIRCQSTYEKRSFLICRGNSFFRPNLIFFSLDHPIAPVFLHKAIPILFICTLVFVHRPRIRFSDEVPFIYPIKANAGYFSFIVA